MNYDSNKLEVPPTGEPPETDTHCECGNEKNLCDSFCTECKNERAKVYKFKLTETSIEPINT